MLLLRNAFLISVEMKFMFYRNVLEKIQKIEDKLEMSSVQVDFDSVGMLVDHVIDANGDPVSIQTTSSSEEDIASCSSQEPETEEIIGKKTR